MPKPTTRLITWPKSTFLWRLTADARTDLLTLGSPRTYAPGTALIGLSDNSAEVVLMLSSAAKVVVHSPFGAGDALLGVRVGGDLVGELAALDSGKRSASVLACGRVRAQVIGQREFGMFLRRHPNALGEVSRMIGERLRYSDRRRVDFLIRRPLARLAHVLVEIMETHGHQVGDRWETDIPLTQAEIGSLAGMATRTVEKLLAQLQRDGLVDRRYRHTVVRNITEMRRVADLTP